MKRLLTFLHWIILGLQCSYAQELSAKVKINYDKLQNLPTASLYENLERDLNDWLNQRRWGKSDFQTNEKVDCLFSITVNEVSDRTKASLLVQSLRPVYGSSYHTPVLYIYDTQFDFDYAQYESLSFDPERFSGKNLTDVIAYYAYLVLGYDANTFSQGSGKEYFLAAQKIAGNAESEDRFALGWSTRSSQKSRKNFVDYLISSTLEPLHTLLYKYHRKGLDVMFEKPDEGKQNIAEALIEFDNISGIGASNSYTIDMFFRAKKEEISKIFNGGPIVKINKSKLKEVLMRWAPAETDRWNNLKI